MSDVLLAGLPPEVRAAMAARLPSARLLAAETGEALLAALTAAAPPALAVVDAALAGLPPRDALERARAAGARVPVLYTLPR
ncbi:MAG TPA: hypothetical protein VFH27_13535, partial [Longimicrobiaceae bacterium]|nr:hypothetical protein [Longimicrobiaceae bacterium]